MKYNYCHGYTRLRGGRCIFSTIRFVPETLSLYRASWDDLCQSIAKKHVDLAHLSAVLVKLEKKTRFDKKRQDEVEDIETSVTEIVQTILDKMGVYDNTCRELRLIKAGGYFDGTKIHIPD